MWYKVSTVEKKLAVQIETYHYTDDDGKFWEFQMENGYRWGFATIECDDIPEQAEDPYNDGFVVSDYEMEDIDLDDGCWMFYHFPAAMPDELKEKIEKIWDEDGYTGFEEYGIDMWECDTIFYGPLEVECVDDSPSEPEPAPDPNSKKWPF
jgi:hypothetical protein